MWNAQLFNCYKTTIFYWLLIWSRFRYARLESAGACYDMKNDDEEDPMALISRKITKCRPTEHLDSKWFWFKTLAVSTALSLLIWTATIFSTVVRLHSPRQWPHIQGRGVEGYCPRVQLWSAINVGRLTRVLASKLTEQQRWRRILTHRLKPMLKYWLNMIFLIWMIQIRGQQCVFNWSWP